MAEEKKEEKKEQPLDKIELKNQTGTSTVCIYRYGGTVTSWKIEDKEQLFVSNKSKWDESKAIRGGIPIVFPQFGPGPMKQHGFARICIWNIDKSDNNSVILSLTDSDLSNEWKQQFPYAFKLQYTISIMDNNSLSTKLLVINNEKEKSFKFTNLLHTYFKVNSKSIQVIGLNGINYMDKLEKNKDIQIKKEDNDKVNGIDKEIDRIYMDINNKDIVLMDNMKSKYKIITIKRTNFIDVVLWNPWIDKAKRMSDFGDNEYQNMVCIEPGNVAKVVTLKPAESKLYTQTLIPSDPSKL
eukprot:150123_1